MTSSSKALACRNDVTAVSDDPSPPAIPDLARRLETTGELPLWLLDDSAMILCLAEGRQPRPGPRTRALRNLFRVTGPTWLATMIVGTVGMLTVAHGWSKMRIARHRIDHPTAVLIGMGAGQESAILAELDGPTPGLTVHLDERDIATLGTIAVPSFMRASATAWREAIRIVGAIRRAREHHIEDHHPHWLARCATQIGRYALTHAWSRRLPMSVQRIVFLAPSPVTFALVDARTTRTTSIEWWQHGSIRHSSMYPLVDRVASLTAPEGRYMQARCSTHDYRLYYPKGRPQPLVGDASRTVLLFSQYDTDTFHREHHVARLKKVSEWLHQRGLNLVVRPHPRESADFWSANFPDIEVQRSPASIFDHIAELHPRLALSWYSTALVDAVLMGVPGACLDPAPDRSLDDVVLDFRNIFLSWNQNREAIDGLISSSDDCDVWRARQFAILFGER